MALQILRKHALNHAWVEPIQDTQYRIQPSRSSPNLGVHRIGQVYWRDIVTPTAADQTSKASYHLYPLGQIDPSVMSLAMEHERWYRTDTLRREQGVVIDVTLVNGACIPAHLCFLTHSDEGYFILAVQRSKLDYGDCKIINVYDEEEVIKVSPDNTELSVRFYHNATTHSQQWRHDNPNKYILDSTSELITNATAFTRFKSRADSLIRNYNGKGMGVFFLDGFVIDTPTTYHPKMLGKELRIEFDSTIREKVFFKAKALNAYRSKVDPAYDKLLLVGPNQKTLGVDYHDDIDFYLVQREAGLGYKGVRLDRMHLNAVRQVTHSAWGIRVDIINDILRAHDFISGINDIEILTVIRHGGMRLKLTHSANRIADLLALPYAQQLSAMAERESNLAIWRASSLENSDYMKLLSSNMENVTDNLVEKAYGYYAITKAVMKSFYKVNKGIIRLDPGFCVPFSERIPMASTYNAERCVFWFNREGKLLGYHTDDTIRPWIEVPSEYRATASYAEVFLGRLEADNGYVGNHRDQVVVTDQHWGYYGHRNYCCGIVNGVLDNRWYDVTGSAYVKDIPASGKNPPRVEWNYSLLSQANLYPMTRFANTVVVQTFNRHIGNIVGPIQILLSEFSDNFTNSLGVAPGHVDVFMDGQPLIADLDYHYLFGGEIYIVKKPDRVNTVITVRHYGLCNPETNEPFFSTDIGFVKNGKLSANNRYDPRDDRDYRLLIGGKLVSSDNIQFDEKGGKVVVGYEGHPYCIEDYHPTIEHFTTLKTIPNLMACRKVDTDVSTFLTPRLPTTLDGREHISGTRWKLFSPVMANVIQIMLSGGLADSLLLEWEQIGSTAENIETICRRFSEFDPILYRRDDDYVQVDPYPFNTALTVSAKQYQFLQQVNILMLKNELNLSPFITVK